MDGTEAAATAVCTAMLAEAGAVLICSAAADSAAVSRKHPYQAYWTGLVYMIFGAALKKSLS